MGGRERGQEAGGEAEFPVTLQRREYLKVRNGKGVQWSEIAGKLDRSSYVIKCGQCVLMTKKQKSNSRQEQEKY